MPAERVKIACDVAAEAYEAGLGWIEIVCALAHIFRLPASIHHPPSRLKAQAMQIAMSLGRQKFGEAAIKQMCGPDRISDS